MLKRLVRIVEYGNKDRISRDENDKIQDGNYSDGSNRLDTPEERISELEYLQKPSKMDRGRKETRRKEEKQHTSVL